MIIISALLQSDIVKATNGSGAIDNGESTTVGCQVTNYLYCTYLWTLADLQTDKASDIHVY